MGVVKYFAQDRLPRKSYSDIAKSLRDQNFLFKILYPIKKECYYACFVVHIPFQVECQDRFKHYRRVQMDKARKESSLKLTLTLSPEKNKDSTKKKKSIKKEETPFLEEQFFEKTAIRYFGLRQSYIAAARKGILQYKRSGNEILRSIFKERLKTISQILPYTNIWVKP